MRRKMPRCFVQPIGWKRLMDVAIVCLKKHGPAVRHCLTQERRPLVVIWRKSGFGCGFAVTHGLLGYLKRISRVFKRFELAI
ncbi:hypothetical protein MUK42_03790 [Musa troglodytarum]|uniref:Uncharacterized protein n=1 Tax=Musa troglodytarum TaxID=320322 RepID=A0A9E7KIU3_9LILI|nr:hypothetical protein MUK42_03790 [Musa troglodytarum]URE17046.1 hypothetical protein MUK42_03790 [Musa troglodytarum]